MCIKFLGIGVDDLFVIVQSWSNIPAHIHHSNSVEERIGLALKHAVRIARESTHSSQEALNYVQIHCRCGCCELLLTLNCWSFLLLLLGIF